MAGPPRRPKRTGRPRDLPTKLPGVIRAEDPVIGTLPYDGYVRGTLYHEPDTSRFAYRYPFREGFVRVWAEVYVEEGWLAIHGTHRAVSLLPIVERDRSLGVGTYSMIVPRLERVRIVVSDPIGTGCFGRVERPIEYHGWGRLYLGPFDVE